MLNFENKVLWLTGANGAISRAIASTFFELGASCVLTDLDEEGVASFASTLDARGQRAVGLKQDASQSADAISVAEAIAKRFGKLDFLVTSAGLYRDQMIHDMTDAQWRQSTAVNLDGVFYTCRAAIPLFAEGGAVVNVASMAGHRGSYMHSHYAASKGGVLTFTRTLALELAPKVRANAVSPGIIDTPLVQPLLDKQGPQLIASTPLKRFGRPQEVAQTVAYLCSDWASFITGETVHVNGGLYITS
ncbi:SDR family NAD(P)-dependent oxidoreductase [Mesorhizobium sp. NZP2298]|uniref:SDR family NAD(P)-dependent oxidoreductase n=1 Tax=Mesorhizobium sp. NZP2298 TaxID=2483403 RepID=UPI001557678B|nr:SDR family NAD(P)-dependent oxidoreductase [Mesorhizobium sp. NZP2298]QKC98336.1 SDR family oxidoreductase [Mesorhizobium sp. NZP2298]